MQSNQTRLRRAAIAASTDATDAADANAPAALTPVVPTATPEAGAARPAGCTHLKLRQLLRRVSRIYDEDAAACGLRGTQYSLLSYIVKLGPIRPADLAQALGLDASTLTRNVQTLVAAGWVVIAPGPDARSRLVVATPAGSAKRVEAQRAWRRSQERINTHLGGPTVMALHALIDRCVLALDAGEPHDPS